MSFVIDYIWGEKESVYMWFSPNYYLKYTKNWLLWWKDTPPPHTHSLSFFLFSDCLQLNIAVV